MNENALLWWCNHKQLDSYAGTARFESGSVDLSSYLMFVLVTNANRGLSLGQNSFFPVLLQFDSHNQQVLQASTSVSQPFFSNRRP
jgi:hypothetical protein